MDKKPTMVRLGDVDRERLELLSRELELSGAAVVRLALRELAERQGIEVKREGRE